MSEDLHESFASFFAAGHHDENLNIPASPLPRGRSRSRSRSRTRPPLTQQRQVIGSPLPSPTPSRSNSREPLYRTTSLETRSRSPSPHFTPTPSQMHEYYGTANLTDRSRSPSPTSVASAGSKPKRGGRRLPATPQKPSSLNLPKRRDAHMPHVIPSPTIPQPHKSPGSINFPKLNASPTHLPRMNIPPPGQRGAVPSRPQPLYSPTEKNDLNMPGSQNSSREQLPGSGMPASRDHTDRGPRYAGPIMNNGRPDARFAERDNRYQDNRYDLEAGGAVVGRPGRQQPVLPNGFKPGAPHPGGRPTDRTMGDMARGPGHPPGAGPPRRRDGQANSESDDEDWC